MKANEFVKTHGLESTKDIVRHYGNHTHITDDARMFITEEFYKETRANYVDDLNSMVKMEDLKRLVASHELVEKHGGLFQSKVQLDKFGFSGGLEWHGFNGEYGFKHNAVNLKFLPINQHTRLERLVDSYELVEKCGGLNSLKAWVKETKSKLSLATYFHCNKPPVLIQIENAEKAIADVESCQMEGE